MNEKKFIRCVRCDSKFRIVHGVPVLINLEAVPKHLQSQIRYFERSSKIYSKTRGKAPWKKKYADWLFSSIRKLKNKILVDDASGSGYMSMEAARRGMYVLSCDLNLSGLVELHRFSKKMGLSNRILFVCCSAENLPIKKGTADAVVANAILEHLPKEQNAIEDITRIAKKGSVAIITVPLAYYLLNPLFILINYIHDKQIGHLRRYTRESLVRKFKGWKVKSVYYTGHTLKVIKTLINIVVPIFDENEIESEDERISSRKLFASNICIIFKRK